MLHLFNNLALALNVAMVFISLINLGWIPTPTSTEQSEIDDSIAALVPMRNEELNVDGVISTLLHQRGLSDFRVEAIDDGSRDGTQRKLSDISAAHFTWRQGSELPSGWLGKNFALHQLTSNVDSEYFVFVDADVRLEPWAINAAIHQMHRKHWDFISPYPRQLAHSWLERLVQPLLQWSWFVSLILPIANRLQWPSMVVANGQFLIVRARAYKAAGGHSAIKSEVLDDMELARSLVRSGFRGGVVNGSQIAECRMYSNARALIEGYSKSQWRAFGGLAGSALASSLLFLTSILPLGLAVGGSEFGLIALLCVIGTRFLVAAKSGSSLASSIFHPLAAAVWILLIKLSWIGKWRGSLQWRGREV